MVEYFKQAAFGIVTEVCGGDIQDTVVVTGSPRSGTTWLAELLREVPGYKMLNEPLNLSSSVLVQDVDDVEWRTYVSKEECAPDLRRVLLDALEGRVGAPHMWRFRSSSSGGQMFEYLRNPKLVVKLIRAGRMLPWFSTQFQVRSIVSTFRHPCAVVSSQLNHKSEWRNSKAPPEESIESGYGGRIPEHVLRQFRSTLAEVDSTAGYLAAVWSLDTYMTLQGPVCQPWIVTTYEDLVEDPEDEMRRILRDLEEPMPEEMKRRFDRPSGSAAEDLKTNDEIDQLSKWRSKLSDSQIGSVMKVVREFGLDDVYSKSLRPNHQALEARVQRAAADTLSFPAKEHAHR